MFSILARHRLVGVALSILVQVGLLVPLVYADAASVVGIPAAVAAAIGGTVAVVFGPFEGALVAFTGAAVFGALGGWGTGELAALAVWPAIVTAAGLFARRVERQRQALGQLVAEQEEDRQRLALELHDGTAQMLAAALMALARIETAESADQAATSRVELRELIHETLGRVRELAVDLRPRALDDFGLPAAAQRLAATFSERTGIAVEVELDGQERLPTEIELALFRVLQESLQGVTGRTDATRVRVTLTRTPTGAVFEVADDGSVVDAGVADGRELVSARERLRLVGGRLTVVTPPGVGTIVRAAVPA